MAFIILGNCWVKRAFIAQDSSLLTFKKSLALVSVPMWQAFLSKLLNVIDLVHLLRNQQSGVTEAFLYTQ